jgi:chromosome segregation ATPase
MRGMQEALEEARDEAKKAKDELKKLKKTLDNYKEEATAAFDKAREHTRKVEEGFKSLVNKIAGNFRDLFKILCFECLPFLFG